MDKLRYCVSLIIIIGPLLYHFEDATAEMSVEMSMEEIFDVSEKIGFVKDVCSINDLAYAQNPFSMYQTIYRCALFIMEKHAK